MIRRRRGARRWPSHKPGKGRVYNPITGKIERAPRAPASAASAPDFCATTMEGLVDPRRKK